MKKFAGLMAASVLGGAAALGFYRLAGFERPIVFETKVQEAGNVQAGLNDYNLAAAENAVDFTTAAEMTVNGVVHVQTAVQVSKGYQSYDPWRQLFYGNGMQQVPPQYANASGSGVIISPDGYIVTNNHVIDKAEEVQITLNNNQTYSAEVVGTDPSTDLALLKVDATDLPAVPYGNSDRLKVGEWVLAVGNPFNLTSTVTAGIVSAKGRDINILRESAGVSAIESFIQTDAAVNPGNSGGALVNTRGELVGINAAIKSNTGSYSGYSFAIPVNIVQKVVEDLADYGVVQRALIGVSIRDITSRLAEQEDLSVLEGVYVAGLSNDGAARAAGVQSGDVIVKVGTVDVANTAQLQEQVGRFRPGDNIMITVLRDDRELEMPITLRNQYGNTQVVDKNQRELNTSLGAVFAPATKDEMKKLGIDHGLKVDELERGKLSSCGITEGFIITRVDRSDVSTESDLSKALKGKSGGVLIEGVYPNGKRAYYGFGM